MTHEHLNEADRLIRQARTAPDPDTRQHLLLEAHARATLAVAQEARLTNLILAYQAFADPDEHLEHPLAELTIRRTIRRRLGLFPDLTPDGGASNGGQ